MNYSVNAFESSGDSACFVIHRQGIPNRHGATRPGPLPPPPRLRTFRWFSLFSSRLEAVLMKDRKINIAEIGCNLFEMIAR